MRTMDDGLTWSAPVEITASVKQPDWTWYATGPGVGIQTRSGRLVIPANHAEADSGVHRSHIFYSDDGGQHWTLGASADPGTNESQVVELADGRLMLNMRNHPPRPENFRMVRRATISGDLVEGRRTRAGEPPAQAASRLPAPERDRAPLLFANRQYGPRGLPVRVTTTRGDLALRRSSTKAAAYSTWSRCRMRRSGCCSSAAIESPYERIHLARLTRRAAEGGARRVAASIRASSLA